jgi:imidazole glycerol phosphate synthase subunit HisF
MSGQEGIQMKVQSEAKTSYKAGKMFLDIPSAAYQAGYSLKHFRRVLDEDRIPVIQIGGKFFIVADDFKQWKATYSEARLQHALDQIDKWIQESHQYAALYTQPKSDDLR